VRRIDENELDRVKGLRPLPEVFVSALDNAESRLVVQKLGMDLGIPVVQGGTGIFAADCVTQVPGGPSIDDQLRGAMTAAAVRERSRIRGNGCNAEPAYVVPSMMCGALVALRVLQLYQSRQPRPPIRWRAGGAPVEERSQSHASNFTDLLS